jgi:hypothetical protein
VKMEFFRRFLKSTSICVHLRFISLSRLSGIPKTKGTAISNRDLVSEKWLVVFPKVRVRMHRAS